jgi:aquaporin Z
MTQTLRHHWPEYTIEALCLGIFMVSAAGFATLLQHPLSPLAGWTMSPLVRRIPMGVAMGLTLIAIIYSPAGTRSGAHMNPVVTLTFFRLGKIAFADACAYIVAQFSGGFVGILVADWLFRRLPEHPAVNFVATVPGMRGAAVAFAAESVISFGMMLTVLSMSNTPVVARFTGLASGFLVACYITLEAPLSGMSMNPARSFGPAVLAGTAGSLWIYFTAPLAGMLMAAEFFVRMRGQRRVRCAKLHHQANVRCIFNCGFMETPA